jgi:hypothetical protein
MPTFTHLTDSEVARLLDSHPDVLVEASVRFPKLPTQLEEAQNLISVIADAGFDMTKTRDIEKVRAAVRFAAEHDISGVQDILDTLYDIDLFDAASLRIAFVRKNKEASDDAA